MMYTFSASEDSLVLCLLWKELLLEKICNCISSELS